ncbi:MULTISPECIES: Ig-like domain repeat protein [Mumia]|uniref:Ig-like domain repeat protein n=1 Tax=Mumia TaxID=1546255 RepID=UPI0014241AE7|nr:Ig-like domain repeat protein [Mumia sp. ZJ1417]QMW65622.1 Ig-like domain repeat protein [Mumia sp. ZJ1417]
MSTSLPRRFRRLVAATAATALAAGTLALAAGPAHAAPKLIDDATFTWALSNEAGGGAYDGSCNFLSAGEAGSTGSSRPWTETDSFYQTTAGNVSIVKPNAAGDEVAPTWATKCLDRTGAPVIAANPASTSENKVVITDGEGTVDPAAGTATIQWDGAFTVAFYAGRTYWTATDPKLTVATDGTGTVTATASGYAADMDDPTQWTAVPSRTVTLATLAGVDVTASGIDITPTYRGVSVTTPAGAAAQTTTGASWGSFPQSFVDFHGLTGQSSYWYSTGSQRDIAKVANPIAVDYTVAPDPAPAKVTVSKTTIPTTGEHEITVTGSGFDPSLATGTRPPLAGKPVGTYVILGTVADTWKPSAGATSSARKAISQKWAVLAGDMATIGGPGAGAIELKADGTFSTTFTVSKSAVDAAPDKLANLGVYTYAAGGATQAAYETFTPIAFKDPAPAAVTSTTTLTAPAKLVYGRTGTATVAVKAPKAVAGSIQLLDSAKVIGTRPVASGKASFALPKNLKVGAHRLSARFVSSNAAVVKPSTSAARTLTITKVATKTAVKVTKKPTRKKAGKAKVTVSGSPKANGKVTLVIKGKGIKKTVRATVKNGKVVVKLPKLAKKGTYKVTATFATTGTHAGSKKTVKVKVTK